MYLSSRSRQYPAKSAIPAGAAAVPADMGSGARPTAQRQYLTMAARLTWGSVGRDHSQAKDRPDRYDSTAAKAWRDSARRCQHSSQRGDSASPKSSCSRLGTGCSGGGYGLNGCPEWRSSGPTDNRAPRLSKPAARECHADGQDLPKAETPASHGSNFMVAGPICSARSPRNRPHYPKWALERRSRARCRTHLCQPNVSQGCANRRSSSGYRTSTKWSWTLRGWEFAPLGSGVKSETSGGDYLQVHACLAICHSHCRPALCPTAGPAHPNRVAARGRTRPLPDGDRGDQHAIGEEVIRARPKSDRGHEALLPAQIDPFSPVQRDAGS